MPETSGHRPEEDFIAEGSAEIALVIGGIYDSNHGISYQVIDVELGADGYEATGQLADRVRYQQLTDGKMPAGTIYSRTVQEFMFGTEVIDGQEYPIFSLREATVNRDDFIANWNQRGAKMSWLHIVKLALQNEDFPLRPSDERPELHGDIQAALEWLDQNDRAYLVGRTILEKIHKEQSVTFKER